MNSRKLITASVAIVVLLGISAAGYVIHAQTSASGSTSAQTQTSASSPQAIEAAIRKAFESTIGLSTKIDSITKTPYSGLYEIRMGSEIIYTDEKAQYVFVGSILNTQATMNYTKQRMDDLSRVNFSELPLALALKMVKGNGKRVIATFEDPNCGPCKQLRKNLQEVDNITIYTFLYNVIAEESAGMSKNIWCASDKNLAWDQWMLKGIVAPPAPANCSFENEQLLALGHKLKVKGTPAVIFTDGSRIPGAAGAAAIEEKLASLSK